jgi:hypothetical protein
MLLSTEKYNFGTYNYTVLTSRAFNICYICHFTCVNFLLFFLTVQSNSAVLFYRRHAVISKCVQIGMAGIMMAVFHLTTWLFIFSWIHTDLVHADECTQ